jgi:afadin
MCSAHDIAVSGAKSHALHAGKYGSLYFNENRFPLAADVIQTMSAAMALLRRCRVNAALTIQLFSQLFHYINMWLFNKIVMEPRLRLCTRRWGFRLKRRLARIEVWAEKQGLELAADCHLARIIQVSND